MWNDCLERKTLVRDERSRWEHGLVPYVFDRKLNDYQIRLVFRAFKAIQDVSCVAFKERKNQKDFIHIVIGHNIGEQDFSLSEDCFRTGPIMHELMHSLGFIHEHTRCDRDNYVNINITNIKAGFVKANFEKRNCQNIDYFNLSYDFNSIMHYKGHEFAIDPAYPTIYRIDDNKYPVFNINKQLGNDNLSELDIKKLRLAYKCF
ncbi:Zinc metalloproteinase nas-6 [Thelohanellus kitauei]|uniref:Metalloendopeptidase n=1 Tax=Thelohanellus kitauei TaxID=669202 RepID=A0A0C2J973_THEKT|nr:Zinc metalloproteinase nas-6 [Thelohanellus kitauei]